MKRWIGKLILFASDFAAVSIAYTLFYGAKFYQGLTLEEAPPIQMIILSGLILSLGWLVILMMFGVYRTTFAVSRTDELLTIFKVVTVGTAFLFITTFNPDKPLTFFRINRSNILYYWFLVLFFLGIGRIIIRTYQRKLLKKGYGRRRTIIIGTGKQGKLAYDRIRAYPIIGFDVKGFIELNPAERVSNIPEPILGTIENYKEVCTQHKIEDVIIALDNPSRESLFEIVEKCNGFPAALRAVADIYEVAVGSARVQHVFGVDLVDILPENYSLGFRIAKRIIDILISAAILTMFLPLLIIIGLIIRFNSKGPVFYRQKRIGQNGEIFTMYKFRSMTYDRKRLLGAQLTQDKDPRVTQFGRFLRQFRIDEIPQFINVLEGDMSVIGPRPELPYYVRKYIKEIPLYSKRMRVKPGLTGWAQVNQEFSESVREIRKKLEYDLYYIENMSIKLDIQIMLATIKIILTRRGG
jgi:exopolysaccharide biosynthesis polyprenyl glycosylphosphotransferase